MARLRLKKKIADLVLTAARYADSGSELAEARGYRRMGEVWSDWLILDRPAVVKALQGKSRVYAGREAELPGDFVLDRRLSLAGNGRIAAAGEDPKGDDLGVPLF